MAAYIRPILMQKNMLKLTDEKCLNAAMSMIRGNLGSNKVMRIQSEETIRNLEQNAMFHALRDQMCEQSSQVGEGKYISPKVMKDWICYEFEGETQILPNGIEIIKRVDTSSLSRKRFAALITHLLNMAYELGMTIEFKEDKHKEYFNGNKDWWKT